MEDASVNERLQLSESAERWPRMGASCLSAYHLDLMQNF
jgi:hypothetical protein